MPPVVTITQPPVLEDLTWFTMNWTGLIVAPGPFPTTPYGTPTPSLAGPFEYGGKLYCVGRCRLDMPHPPPDYPNPPFPPYNPAGFGPFVVFSSSNAGATWAAPDMANRPYFADNPANQPATPTGVIYQRIGDRIYYTMLVIGQMIAPWTSGNAFEVAGYFDLATDTYGPVAFHDTGWSSFGGSGVVSPAAAFLWPISVSGVLTFVGCDANNGLIPADPDLGKGRLLAGPVASGYAGLTDITPAMFTISHFALTVLSVQVDAVNVTHIIFSSLSDIPGDDVKFWYMRLYPDLHTDAFQQLVIPSPPGVTPSFGVPSFNGVSFIIPVWFNTDTLAVFRFTNYDSIAPVVSYEPIVQYPDITNLQWAATVTSGARSVLFWCAKPFGLSYSEIDYSYNDGTGWSVGAPFCDASLIVIPPGDYNNGGEFTTIAVSLLLNGDFGILTGSRWQQFLAPFFFGNANMFLAGNLGAPPPPPPVQVLTQGSRRMTVLVPNHWDRCLLEEVYHEKAVAPHKECCEPILWQDIAWIRAPKDYVPFRKVSAIPTPLAISGDVEVLNFQVPHGYDGLIAGLFHLYTGPGFREGGGDIEWRLRINQTYAIHLGQVLVTLGSQAQSYLLDGGIQIQSGQRIQYIVSAPNLSGGILPLASQIVCGLEGLFYARA